MDNHKQKSPNNNQRFVILVLELLIYGVLLYGYFKLIQHFLGDALTRLFHDNLLLYGFVALALIAVQGVVLGLLSSLIMKVFNPGHSE